MAEAREALAAVAAGRAAPEFPMSVQPVSPPSWRGAPVSQNSTTRAMAPASASRTPPPHGTRIDVRQPSPPQRQQSPPPQQSFHQQPPPPPRRPAEGRPTAKETASKRSTIITALAIVAAAVVGIMLASFLSSGGNTQKTAEPGSSASLQPSASSGNVGAPEAGGGSKLPPKVTDPAGPDQGTQEKMLRDYFALAPGDPTSSYQWLLPAMQSQTPASVYKGFWSSIKSVQVESISRSEDLAYIVDLKYTRKDNSTAKERKLIVLNWNGDQILLQREQLLAS
jgi:hypothetical protein